MVKFFSRFIVVSFLFLVGCVSVKIPEPLPENTTVNVSVNVLWKSNVGNSNAIEQTTDTKIPLPTLMQEQ